MYYQPNPTVLMQTQFTKDRGKFAYIKTEVNNSALHMGFLDETKI